MHRIEQTLIHRSQKHFALIFVTCMTVIGVAVRLWQFGAVPPGINQDEASLLYDAWSIFNYGMDRHGYNWPIMLVSWGSGMHALSAYLALPFIAIAEMSTVAVRLPNLVLGILSIPLFAFVLYELFGIRTALVGTLLIAINPWHIMMSRWGLESNVLPSLFLGAFACLLLTRRNPRWILLSGALFALCLYAYGTAYVVVPLFLFCSFLYMLWTRMVSWKWLCAGLTLFAIMAMPIMLYFVVNTFKLPAITTRFLSIPRLAAEARYQTVGVIPGLSEHAWQRMQDNWSALFSMLERQNDGLLYNALPEFGILYLWCMPFVLIGAALLIYRVIQNPKGIHTLFFVWLVCAIVLGGLVYPNINRLNILFLPLIALLALAIETISTNLAITSTIVVLLFTSFAQFTSIYFTQFPKDIAPQFHASLEMAVARASARTTGSICVTDRANMPYVYALVGAKTHPQVFIVTNHVENPGAEFEFVSSFDRFVFGVSRCDPTVTRAYVLAIGERTDITSNPAFETVRFDNYITAVRKN